MASPRKMTPADVDLAKAMVAEGFTRKYIAAHFGVSVNTLRFYLVPEVRASHNRWCSQWQSDHPEYARANWKRWRAKQKGLDASAPTADDV